MTTSITIGALTITAGVAFIAALTTVIGLYFWPKSEPVLTFKDVVFAILFAVTEPFSRFGNSDTTTFSIHALIAFLVYIISRRFLIKISGIECLKNLNT